MLTINLSRINSFIKRERFYIFLLVCVIFFHLAFSLFNQLLEDSGLDKIFEEESFKGKGVISNEEITEIISSSPTLSLIFLFLAITFIFFALIGIVIDIVYLYRRNKKVW